MRSDPSQQPLGLARRSLVAVVALVSLLSGKALAQPEARAFIEAVGGRTTGILNDPAMTKPAKLEKLVEMLDEATNLQLVAQLVLGRYWRTASAAQRREYVELFEAVLIRAMARRLNAMDGGGATFEITGSRQIDERDAEVETIVRTAANPPTRVKWRARRQDDRLAIIDIVVEDISMVITYRAEVGEIVARDGMDGLLAAMREWLSRPA